MTIRVTSGNHTAGATMTTSAEDGPPREPSSTLVTAGGTLFIAPQQPVATAARMPSPSVQHAWDCAGDRCPLAGHGHTTTAARAAIPTTLEIQASVDRRSFVSIALSRAGRSISLSSPLAVAGWMPPLRACDCGAWPVPMGSRRQCVRCDSVTSASFALGRLCWRQHRPEEGSAKAHVGNTGREEPHTQSRHPSRLRRRSLAPQ